jgi:hypothetical protein
LTRLCVEIAFVGWAAVLVVEFSEEKCEEFKRMLEG